MAKKILISGEIGWDVDAADISAQFAKGGDVDIDIASPGGRIYRN